MDRQTIDFPSGFRFNPYEQELISCYLKPKVLGKKLPSNVVEERQVYGPNANPWQVFDPQNHSWILSEVTPGKFEKVTYAFVNLTKIATVEREKKRGRDNYMKRAGCGTWGGKTSRTEIRDHRNGDVIGERRLLVFEVDDDSHQDLHKVGYWKMHEYWLRGVNDKIKNPRNIVLCKITLDTSRLPATKLHPKINNDHPVQTTSKPQKKNSNVESGSSSTMNSGTVDGNQCVMENSQEANTAQTRRDDLVVANNYRDKGKEDYSASEPEIVDISDDEEEVLVIATSPTQQLDTGYSKPVASDFCWPAKYNNDYEKIKKEGGRRELDFGKPKVHFSGYQKPNEEQPIKDTTTVLGKRRSTNEILCALTKKLKPASPDICRPPKHDVDCQKTEKEAGAREEQITNFINFL